MSQKNWLKNTACFCLGLFFISLSSLLMTQIYFQHQIDNQIQNISILKDIRYPNWGKNPNPTNSIYTQNFNIFELKEIDNQIHSDQSNITKKYQYHYQYQNTSFSQGNSGRLNFINKWELKQLQKNPPTLQKIKTINLAADKVYNYDHYAPPQRKFALFYNYFLNTITGPFLEQFFTAYLHKFFFEQKDLVIETVFKPLGFQPDRASSIYDHPLFGWSNVQNFKQWVKLSLKGKDYAVRTQTYEEFISQLNLTIKEVQNLLFEKSTIYNMIFALNGTIKTKVMQTKGFSYKKCKDFCSNQELAGFQIASSFLTGGDPLFASLALNKTTKQFNTTIFQDIEYTTFCTKTKSNCLEQSNMAQFFAQHYLGDFELMDFVWNNQNSQEQVQSQFHLQPGKGRSIINYIIYLHDKFINGYNQHFSWAQNSYNHIENTVNIYKKLFLVELYSRAFYRKFIQKKQFKCEDYFADQFSQFKDIACQNQQAEADSWNIIAFESVIRKYVKAYFYFQGMRDQMSQDLKIPYQKLITFFKNEQKSLLASQIKQINQIFKQNFGCSSNKLAMCTPQELFCLQWGSNKIFQNLPTDLFSNKIKNINQWDLNNTLNGLNPDYLAIIGKQKTVGQCMSILSSDSDDGVFNFFNLLKMSEQSTQNVQYQDRLKYVGKNIVQIYFKGAVEDQDVDQLFKGFQSDIVKMKQKMPIKYGGVPWLENKLKLAKTDNKQQIKNNELELVPQFDTIDTGIFNQSKTRQISKIWGESTSSSKYTVYRGTKINDEGEQVPVDIFYKYKTDKKVEGTNLLGFHPEIKSDQNLKVFSSQAYQSMDLIFDQQLQYDSEQLSQPIKAYKYKLKFSSEAREQFIGIEELNQNFIQLSDLSYAIVEPTTGLTLQLSMVYLIKSTPLYLKFIISNFAPLSVYSCQINYTRKGIQQMQNIKANQSDKWMFTLISIILGAASFLFAIILGVAYRLMTSKDRKIKQTLLESQVSNENI